MTERIYPEAIDKEKVGEYAPLSKSGGGGRFDAVLEYRVWVHPDSGDDNFVTFATYEEAKIYLGDDCLIEEPIALVRQDWYITHDGDTIKRVMQERITEWQVDWMFDDTNECLMGK